MPVQAVALALGIAHTPLPLPSLETNLGSWMRCLAFHSVVYLGLIDNVCKEMSLKMKPEARALEALPLASDS